MRTGANKKRTDRRDQAALALLLPVTFFCTSPKSSEKLRRALQAPPAQRVRAPSPQALRDVRGAIHIHSYLSHDSQGRPEEIRQAASEAGLQFIMTNHSDPRISTEGALVLAAHPRSYPRRQRPSILDRSEKALMRGTGKADQRRRRRSTR